MSVTVKIPTQLRSLTSEAAEVPAAGDTIADVIGDLERKHPGIGDRLLSGPGELRRFVNVYVDGEDVRFLDGLATAVSPGASVAIIPAVAGG
ncbi:MAG: ubiquitin-like small modifier protein 1 [Actinomycetota bacterium]